MSDIEEAQEETEEKEEVEEEKSLATVEEEEEEDILPFVDSKILEDAPPEIRREMTRAIKTSVSMMTAMAGPMITPLASAIAKALDSDHLTSLIESINQSAELEFNRTKLARWTNFLYLIVVLIFAGFALWTLKDSNPDLIKEIFILIAVLFGGLGAGYGYLARQQREP